MEQLGMLLKAQITLYQKLLELSKLQTKELVEGNAMKVQTISNEIEKIMKQLTQLESKRQTSIDTLMLNYKINEKVSLAEFVEMIQIDRNNKTVILNLTSELEKIANDLKFYIQQNKILLKKAMQFIDFNMNLITSTAAGVTYAPKGQEGNVISKRKMFDQII